MKFLKKRFDVVLCAGFETRPCERSSGPFRVYNFFKPIQS